MRRRTSLHHLSIKGLAYPSTSRKEKMKGSSSSWAYWGGHSRQLPCIQRTNSFELSTMDLPNCRHRNSITKNSKNPTNGRVEFLPESRLSVPQVV